MYLVSQPLECKKNCLEYVISIKVRPLISVSTGMTVFVVSYLQKHVTRPTAEDGVL